MSIEKIKKIFPIKLKQPVRNAVDKIDYKRNYRDKVKYKFENAKSKQRIVTFCIPEYGNLGDHAIAEAEKQFILERFPHADYIEISIDNYLFEKKEIMNYVRENDVLLITGGGFLGNLWIEAENMVRDIVVTFEKNKIIIFPQTLYFDEKQHDYKKEIEISKLVYSNHTKLTMILREKQSFKLAKSLFKDSLELKLIPDIVTFMEESKGEEKRNNITFVIRNDLEKLDHSSFLGASENYIKNKNYNIKNIDNVVDKNIRISERNPYLEEQFANFRKSKLIITDRLHGMIFALITGTPCIALNNSSGKVKGVSEWLTDYQYIRCLESDFNQKELFNIIEELLSYGEITYKKNDDLNKKFDELETLIASKLKV